MQLMDDAIMVRLESRVVISGDDAYRWAAEKKKFQHLQKS